MLDESTQQYELAEKLKLKEIKKDFPKPFHKVNCPSCEEEVIAENINLHNCMGKCGSCNVIFSIEDEVESVKRKEEVKQTVLRPEGIDLFYFKDDLEITLKQQVGAFVGLGIFIFFLVAFFAILFYFIDEISLLYPLISFLGLFYFSYKGSKYSNEKTFIDVNNKFLTISSRPRNLKKDRRFAVDEIEQLYLKNNGTGYYIIYMQINSVEGQKHEKLIATKTLSKARYLEQEIERYLNLENKEVPESNV